MICRVVNVGGVTAIVCGPKPRPKQCSSGCGTPASLLCDWKMGDGKTCDAPICRACAKEVDEDKHLCREHQTAYHEWLAARGEE